MPKTASTHLTNWHEHYLAERDKHQSLFTLYEKLHGDYQQTLRHNMNLIREIQRLKATQTTEENHVVQ